ncbi:hypothetical protein LUZ61_005363 [Rhynchospora tenuis]|uniref:PB1 domain-containing protein n=1 Tax=Rhynchospora tenuis TaxID=198213 RepID=A0AAD5ZPP6_9POAL|nr:hypothetical protein LUZ61_005363 [Rhynchospora tenuis]
MVRRSKHLLSIQVPIPSINSHPLPLFLFISSTSLFSLQLKLLPEESSKMATPEKVVFKVKYGDNIKRINGSVHHQILDLKLAQLRSKIRECFNINHGTAFNLTYIDEDGDAVLLGDDADLHDAAIKQGLNPLRIDIKLKYNPPPTQNPFSKVNHDGLDLRRLTSLGMDAVQKRSFTSVQDSSTACDMGPPYKFPRQAQVEPTLMHAQPNWNSGFGPRPQMHLRNSFVGGQFSPATLPIMGGQVEPMVAGQSSRPNGNKCEVCGVNVIAGQCYKKKGKYIVCSTCYYRMVISCEDFATPSYDKIFASFDSVAHKDQIYFSVGYERQRGICGTQICFVQDITIPVGTRLAPNTPFKKTWRVNYNSTINRMPYGTKLTKICGIYGFITPWEVKLEIPPQDGLSVQKSIDVSLDLKAPTCPGKYFACYSLASFSGFEFGEPFLVAVDVVANLSASQNATINNVMTGSLGSTAATKTHAKNVKPTTDTENNKVINKSEEPVPAGNSGKQVVIVEQDDDGLEKMVEKLVEMGYIDKDLNRKVLRSNNYDLGLAIDALDGIRKDLPKDD